MSESEPESKTDRLRVRFAFGIEAADDPDPPRFLPDRVIGWDAGRIVEFAPASGTESLPVTEAVAIPALINLHTHLEFSNRSAPLPEPLPFTGWIRQLLADRGSRTVPLADRYRTGFRDLLPNTGGVGEIATEPWPETTEPFVLPDGLRMIRYREAIGLTDDRIAEITEMLRSEVAARNERLPKGITPGLSPHAPYTVRFDFYRELIDTAREQNLPVAVHLAETVAERELIERGTGEFADFLRDLGLWQPGQFPSGTMRDYLQPLADLPSALVVHGNHLTDAELEFISANRSLTVVYCPRTHRYFDHPPHPWRRLREMGGRVAFGTDSRASNPDADLWGELTFLADRFPEVPASTLLTMATGDAADAVGWPDRGRLAPDAETPFLLVGNTLTDRFDPETDLFTDRNPVRRIG